MVELRSVLGILRILRILRRRRRLLGRLRPRWLVDLFRGLLYIYLGLIPGSSGSTVITSPSVIKLAAI